MKQQNMIKLLRSEMHVLKAYLQLPVRKLLNHQFEAEEDYLWFHVDSFLHGQRFKNEFTAFSKEELEVINSIISRNMDNDDRKDLLTAMLLTKTVCNIMNKYKKISGK